MKTKNNRTGFLPAALAGFCLLSPITQAANILVGSGPDISYFVIESPNIGIRTYEISYTYDPMAMQDGFALLDTVLGADSQLSASLSNFGSIAEPNFFVNSFTFNSVTETSVSSSPFVPYWAHWVSGGEAGFPTAAPVADGTWTEGSGISSPYRFVVPGSWDALFYSDGATPPSVSPVPEPSAFLLAMASSLLIFVRRRSR